MPRRNHPKHTRNDIKYFDVVQVYEPYHEDVRKFISVPRKTIFVNMAASPAARVIRVGWDICDTLQKMPSYD